MRYIAIAVCLALAGCNGASTTVQSASVLAEKTTTSANQLYIGASQAGQALVANGLLDKATFKAADAKAYAVLLQVRLGQATFQQLADATKALTGAQ